MRLPPAAAVLAGERAGAVPFADLKRAAAALSDAYRASGNARGAAVSPEARVAAYLAVRMPATFAASFAVLAEVRQRLGAGGVESFLDIGAGAGAATLAAAALFPGLRQLDLIEPDAAMAAAGRELLPQAAWHAGDLRSAAALPAHDLVCAAYSLGEVMLTDALAAADRMWHAARFGVVVIEPGSPAGFSRVRAIRARLLSAGAHMLAPCPAAGPCPMRDPDWCHFACRIERSSLHRRLKEAALPFEDEKFSYVALVKEPVLPAPARIIRRPSHAPGLITLELCEGSRTTTLPVTRRDRDAFRAARRAGWGEAWPANPGPRGPA